MPPSAFQGCFCLFQAPSALPGSGPQPSLNPRILTRVSCRNAALVILNGSILGVHRQPLRFAAAFRRLRRCNRVGEFVSVYIQQECCHIASDGGRSLAIMLPVHLYCQNQSKGQIHASWTEPCHRNAFAHVNCKLNAA